MAGRLNKLFGAQDMTVGSPMRNLIQFSIPLLIGNLAQQLYNTVDSIVVGHYVGDSALAAVGTSMPIMNLLLVLFVGISTGAGIMVSQYFGAKDREALSKTIGTSLTLTLVAGLMITIVGPLVTRPLMGLLNTPPDVFDMACDYLIIVFLGMVGCAYYNIVSGLLRGLGDSISPLLFLLLACGLNIVLDLLFVAAFRWGVAGVAWATILAQGISAVFCLIRLARMGHVFDLNRRMLRPDKKLSMQLIKLGLPSGITQAIFSLSAIVVQSLTNSFGTNVIASSTVVMRVDGFAMMPNFTFGMAMTTYTGQNIGAGKMDRVNKGAKSGLILSMGVAAVLVSIILLCGRWLMLCFTDTPEVIALGSQMLRILAVGYIGVAVTQSLSGVMRGAGETMIPMWISIVTTVIVRVPIAYAIAYLTRSPEQPVGDPQCLYYSLLISWVLGAVLTFVFYHRGKWRNKAIIQPVSEEQAV